METDKDQLIPKKEGLSTMTKLCLTLLAVVVLLIIIVASVAAATNIDEDECGTTILPNSFFVDKRDLSEFVRQNIDIFAVKEDGSEGEKVGELYRKLVTRDTIYRFVDKNETIGASMEMMGSGAEMSACKSPDTFHVFRDEHSHGSCETNDHYWTLSYRVAIRHNGTSDFVEVAESTTFSPSDSPTLNFTNSEGNVLASLTAFEDKYLVEVDEDSDVPAYVFTFLTVVFKEGTDLDCNEPSQTPTRSASPSPSPSPSSAGAVSATFALSLAFAMLVAMF